MKRALIAISLVALLALAATAAAASADGNRTFTAHLSGGEEVPANASRGTGEAIFQLDPSGDALSYRLVAANIDNVVASHIHVGAAGVNGPVVAFLFGTAAPGGGTFNGVLATGTITAANLVGPLAGHPLSDLISALESGGAYVNVHTNDGVDPANTGPGDFPGGEIRGQIR